MALTIPIISEFDGKGIDKAIKEFKQLETVGEKAQFAIKKAAIPAAAALTAVAGALGMAAKAAAEDEQQQAILANTMQNVVGATDATVKATEDMIGAMSRATGTADSELRPAFSALLVGTKDVGEATSALGLAQDIAIATGVDLAGVSDALAKAYAGNMKGLQALSPEMKGMIKEGASLDMVMMALNDNFGGAAARSAETAAGKFKILKNSLGEFQESIGAILLPLVSALLPKLQALADWAQRNPKTFLYVAGTIAAVASAITVLNIAIALNPVALMLISITALSAAMIFLEQKTNALSNAWGRFGAIIRLVLGPLYDVVALAGKLGLIDKISLPSFTSTSPSAPVSTLPPALRFAPVPSISLPSMPMMPILPEPSRGGGGGGGGGGGNQPIGINPPQFGGGGGGGVGGGNGEQTIQVNVTGGLATSAEIGQAVVNAIRAYNRSAGPAQIQVA